jgi:hypothetical protein
MWHEGVNDSMPRQGRLWNDSRTILFNNRVNYDMKGLRPEYQLFTRDAAHAGAYTAFDLHVCIHSTAYATVPGIIPFQASFNPFHHYGGTKWDTTGVTVLVKKTGDLYLWISTIRKSLIISRLMVNLA